MNFKLFLDKDVFLYLPFLYYNFYQKEISKEIYLQKCKFLRTKFYFEILTEKTLIFDRDFN